MISARLLLESVLVGALVVVAVVVRWHLLGLGFDSDEVGTVVTGTWWSMLDHPETTVNPPLWRWVWCLAFPPWEAATWGRRFAFACSVLAVPAGYVVARRASGSAAAALAAGLLLALHPWNVRYGGMFRVYATFSLLLLVHLGTLAAAIDGRRRGITAPLAVLSAMLLPWLHYLAVPIELALGLTVLVGLPGRRRWVLAYAPAALGVLPLAPFVLGAEEGRYVSPDREPLRQVLLRLASLDLHPPPEVWPRLSKLWTAWTGMRPPLGEVMAETLLLAALVAILAWRRQPTVARLALGGHIGLLAGVLALSQVQYVRPPTVIWAVTLAGPALASAVRAVPWRAPRAILAVVGLVWVSGGLGKRLHDERAKWEAERAGPWIAEAWPTLDRERAGRPFVVSPAASLWTVWFHLAHDVPRRAPSGPGCAGYDPCFVWRGVTWAGVDRVGDGSALDAIVLRPDPYRPEGFAAACAPLRDEGAWGLWDCRKAAEIGSPEAEPPVRR